jgi:5-(hydroxymethyl)furfural/furfural oxidase
MLMLISNKSGWHRLGRHVGGIGVLVLKSFSKGSVELVSADPAVPPRVRFNLLEDPRDCSRLIEGLRKVLQILDDDEIARLRDEVFEPDSAIATRLARHSIGNWLAAWFVSTTLRITPLRHALLRGRTIDVRSMAKNPNALCDYIRKYAQAVYHPCGTCRMGNPKNSDSVVDPSCRVLGISGLRVVDASIFPTIPRGQTHFPVLMAAEKMADVIKATWNSAPHNALAEKTSDDRPDISVN